MRSDQVCPLHRVPRYHSRSLGVKNSRKNNSTNNNKINNDSTISFYALTLAERNAVRPLLSEDLLARPHDVVLVLEGDVINSSKSNNNNKINNDATTSFYSLTLTERNAVRPLLSKDLLARPPDVVLVLEGGVRPNAVGPPRPRDRFGARLLRQVDFVHHVLVVQHQPLPESRHTICY